MSLPRQARLTIIGVWPLQRRRRRDFAAPSPALAIGQILCWASLFYAFSSFVLPMQRELRWDEATLMGALTAGLRRLGRGHLRGGRRHRSRSRPRGDDAGAAGGRRSFAWSRHPAVDAGRCVGVLGAAMAMTLYDPAFMVLTKRYPLRYREGITALTLVGGFASTLSFPAWLRCSPTSAGATRCWSWPACCCWWSRRCTPGHCAARPVAAPHGDDAADDATMREACTRPRSGCWPLLHAVSFASAALWAHVMPIFVSKGFDALQATAVLVWFGPAQVFGRVVYAWVGRGLPLRAMGVAVLLGIPLSLACWRWARTAAAAVSRCSSAWPTA